ncbi:transketolase [bacterium]|nr:transketolase [bacterium]
MQDSQKQILEKAANTIRGLAMDGTDTANSGHPGLPLGCAEIGAYLYACGMRHNPANPNWLGRDRFILSAGHGSMLLYSLLHLSGYEMSLEDLMSFRQLDSPTPGHPEYGEAPGVETTTGPLGQGFANAAGIALGNKMMAATFGVEEANLLDGKIFVLAGDGCMMEGITNETGSLAAHLQLDNLIVIYDSNDICLDGPTKETFTEDTSARFRALGWAVEQIDGHNLEEIEKAVHAARERKGQPSLIVAKTTIGKGSPHKQGTSDAHGSPLGEEESKLAKQNLGIPDKKFWVPEDVKEFFKNRQPDFEKYETEWQDRFDKWAQANPEKAEMWVRFENQTLPEDIDEQIRGIEMKPKLAGRKASQGVLQKLHDLVPFLLGGSADLSVSDSTMMKGSGICSANDYSQRNIKFGVREHCMGAMTSGLALQGMTLPFCGTFLTFSDYMRNSIRLACLMGLRVVYQFTHDSILLGEDGPTHQPVEHIPSLRVIPNLTVFRPADTNEVKAAWSWILRKADGPALLALSRQGLPDLPETNVPTDEGVGRGAYILRKGSNPDQIDYCLLATGSEVSLALEVADKLTEDGKSVRVVSFPSWEIFDEQDKAYQDSVLGGKVKQYWSIEAAAEQGWHKYIGRDGHTVAMHSFGASAPGKTVADHFGFTADKILALMKKEA